jgi:hypothetical protein
LFYTPGYLIIMAINAAEVVFVMPKYCLVSLYDPESERHLPGYWMLDDGEKWKHFLKGVLKPKHPNDVVKEVVYAEGPQSLDWSKTPLVDPGSNAGWLSRGGAFYGCPINHHDQYACYVLGMEVSELNEKGWARVRSTRYFECEQELSDEQKQWLAHHGHRMRGLC